MFRHVICVYYVFVEFQEPANYTSIPQLQQLRKVYKLHDLRWVHHNNLASNCFNENNWTYTGTKVFSSGLMYNDLTLRFERHFIVNVIATWNKLKVYGFGYILKFKYKTDKIMVIYNKHFGKLNSDDSGERS